MRNIFRQSYPRVALFVLISLFSELPCYSAPKLTDAVTQFNSGVQQNLGAIQNFYLQMNDYARDLYFEELLLDPAQPIAAKNKQGAPTALEHQFTDSDINARIAVLQIISAYSQGLAQIADPDAAKEQEDQLASLGSSIVLLNNDINTLYSNSTNNPSWSKYAGPLSNLVGLMRSSWIGWQADRNLKDAVLKGAPDVESLIDALKQDINESMEVVFKGNAQDVLLRYTRYYNRNMRIIPDTSDNASTKNADLVNMSGFTARAEFLDRAHKAAERYANIQSLDPSQSLDKMKIALQSLQSCCTDKKTPQPNIDAALANVSVYTHTVLNYVNALNSIRASSRE
jgi:hypothetical protein